MSRVRKVLAPAPPSPRVARAPFPLLALAALLVGSVLLFQAHTGRMTVSTTCVTPDATPEDPDPAPVCKEHGVGWWPWVGVAAIALFLAAGLLLVRHVRAHPAPAARLAAASLAALGIAAVLLVAWLGGQGGSTLCVPGAWSPQADAAPQACDPVTTAPAWWVAYAGGVGLGAALLGALGAAAAPLLARAHRRHGG